MSCFKKNLARIRETAGFTQEALAQKINVTRQAVSAWERGRTEPDIETLIKLAEALNVDVEDLIFDRKHKHYKQFQKKYLLCTIVCLSIAMVSFLLMVILGPYFKELINRTYEGIGAYFLVFQWILPTMEYLSLGIFAASALALFQKTNLKRPWKTAALILGWITIAPCALAIGDYCSGMLLSSHKMHIYSAIYMRTVPLQALQVVLFIIFPFVSGFLLFMGFNGVKQNVKDIESDKKA